ncbi:MAG TPA: cohesin domain-containing protein [Candidatus Saccharimonadales bacterium]|nr:cohesin domain-containing protein [Candidatus Saccharimonadales bacterium]
MKIKLKFTAFLAVILLGLGIAYAPRSLATTGQIYVSPGSSSVQIGNTVTVALRVNPGTSINAVQATVGYDSSALQFLSTSLGVFSTCVQNSGGGGSVVLSCALLGSSTSSDSLIADISFKALAGSGSSTLSISGANAANNGTYTDPSSVGGTVSFSSPAPAPIPSGSGGGSTSHSSSAGSSSAPTQPAAAPAVQPAAPKVSLTVNTDKIQFTTASFKLHANVPVQAFIKYGTDKNNLNLSTDLSSPSQTPTIGFDSANLTPGTIYYYQVVAKVGDSIVAQSPVKQLTTKGFTVRVAILDSHYHPLANRVVTLHSTPMTVKTDGSGVATFTNVAPGPHHVEYQVGKTTYQESVYVNNDLASSKGEQTASPQTAAVVLTSYQQATGKSPLYAVLVILALLGASALLYAKKGQFVAVVQRLRPQKKVAST